VDNRTAREDQEVFISFLLDSEDLLLAILAMLSSQQKGIEEMGELGVIPCLLSIIRESICRRNKENCIAILQTICILSQTNECIRVGKIGYFIPESTISRV
jgi:hypothetical protein